MPQDPSTLSHVPPRLTAIEKLGRALGLLKAVLVMPFSIVRRLVASDSFDSKTFRRQVMNSVIANVTGNLNVRQLLSLQPPTGITIAKFCKKKCISHEIVTLDCSPTYPQAALHFLNGDPSTPGNVVLYFHGGGYIYPMLSGTVDFALRASIACHSPCLAILEYKLAPEMKHPGQLAQVVAAIQYLLKDHRPDQLIIGGDSAGGNLVLAVLAHISKPHPAVPPLVSRNSTDDSPTNGSHTNEHPFKLRGAFAISPRTQNDAMTPSYQFNKSKDCLQGIMVKQITDNWVPDPDVYAAPAYGTSEFWSKVAAESVIILVGGHEIYLDDNVYMGELMRAEQRPGAKVQLAICPGEAHIQCVMDMGLGVSGGHMTRYLWDWFARVSADR